MHGTTTENSFDQPLIWPQSKHYTERWVIEKVNLEHV